MNLSGEEKWRLAKVLLDALYLGRGPGLTDCQQKVLECRLAGLSATETAKVIGRSANTVHDHIKAIHKKLGVESINELYLLCVKRLTDADTFTVRSIGSDAPAGGVLGNMISEEKN